MTAFTPNEKVSIRLFLGYPSLFHQFEPRLEHAIEAIQSVTDGGVLPDGYTADKVRSIIAELAVIDSKLVDTQTYAMAYEADEVQVDFIRAGFYLKMEGRRLIAHLAIILGTRPVRDYYSGMSLREPGTDPFSGFQP
jgi:hypothetical protein